MPKWPWKNPMDTRLQDREIRKFMDFGVENFAFAAYGALRQGAAQSQTYTLDATYQKYVSFDVLGFSVPRGVTVDLPNNRMAPDIQGNYIFSYAFTLSHNESNQGRQTNFRIYNESQGIAGPPVPIGIGRNTPVTNMSAAIPAEISAFFDGDFWSIEFGGGDSVIGEFNSFNWVIWSISPIQEQIDA